MRDALYIQLVSADSLFIVTVVLAGSLLFVFCFQLIAELRWYRLLRLHAKTMQEARDYMFYSFVGMNNNSIQKHQQQQHTNKTNKQTNK